eukprot:1154627-Pelagomonas_calceolata.AAC.6
MSSVCLSWNLKEPPASHAKLNVNFVLCLPGQVLLGATLLELQGAFPAPLDFYLFAPAPLAFFSFCACPLAAFLLPFSVHISRGPHEKSLLPWAQLTKQRSNIVVILLILR